ncbi:Putative uncharacterized protein [Thermobacillus xylanilyticus]|uniref:Nitroreductase n=1 Tax=Thermobacillus xylanilyticus TaxID=76633 RepID=A0ABN7S8S0_THEXY|nr:nitroreductase [Thermobacillus xylanilyticus]CAG5092231.1 Putative uncharacterized protein [Thermobacillus xylanilyticus]
MNLGMSIAVNGLVLSVSLTAVIVGTLAVEPRLLLRSYPADIRRAAGAQTAPERRTTRIFGLIFLLLLIGVPAVSTGLLERSRGGDMDFLTAFLNGIGILSCFNAVDLFLIDWLLFCTVTPRFLVIEGTEGMAGYKNYRFHFRGYIVGTMLAAIASLLIASVFVLL